MRYRIEVEPGTAHKVVKLLSHLSTTLEIQNHRDHVLVESKLSLDAIQVRVDRYNAIVREVK